MFGNDVTIGDGLIVVDSVADTRDVCEAVGVGLLSVKCVIVVVIVTDGLLLFDLICDTADVSVKYDGVGCVDILAAVLGEFDDENVTVWSGVVLGYGEKDASADSVICTELV